MSYIKCNRTRVIKTLALQTAKDALKQIGWNKIECVRRHKDFAKVCQKMVQEKEVEEEKEKRGKKPMEKEKCEVELSSFH